MIVLNVLLRQTGKYENVFDTVSGKENTFFVNMILWRYKEL